MYGASAAQHSDALLSPYLNATSEAESESLLTSLLEEQAGPIIKKIIRSKLDDRLGGQESEDVYGEVVAQLIERLRRCKMSSGDDAIRDFRNYVAVTTYNACNEHLRSKYPERRRLKNRLRYLLTHHTSLGLWETAEGHWLCGFAGWANRRTDSATVDQLQKLNDAPEVLASHRASLVDLSEAIFTTVDAPVELEALVNTVAALLGIKDLPAATSVNEEEFASTETTTNFVAEVEHRSYLRHLWFEIVQLPLSQRAALLLNLRDLNEGVVMLLPLTGIATIRQIAEALAIPAEEFSRLWSDLPLDDAAIALRLGVTRQQVINLRKSARARLSRRMRSVVPKGSESSS